MGRRKDVNNRQDRKFDIWEWRGGRDGRCFQRYIILAVDKRKDGVMMKYGDPKYQEGGYNRGWTDHATSQQLLERGFKKIACGC